MPEMFVKMNDALAAGDFDRAQALQNAVCEVIYSMCSGKGNMYAVAKAVLNKRAGLELGGVRAPLLNLQDGDEAVVDKTVELINKALAI